MTRQTWKVLGPTLVVIALAFIVGSYWYNQRTHELVVGRMPVPSNVPGADVYGAGLTGSEEGKDLLRVWQANTRRSTGPEYDLEVRLNDVAFFQALAAVEGRSGGDADQRYHAYRDRYSLDHGFVFSVEMHAPKGGLRELDPSRMMALRLDTGDEYGVTYWSESDRSTGNHRVGVATFGGNGGQPIAVQATQRLELIWRGAAPNGERRLAWDLRGDVDVQ